MFQASLSVRGLIPCWCRGGRAEAWRLAQEGARRAVSWGSCGDAEPHSPPQATLLVSILWMPALLPLASRLLLLPRALLSMASGSPPSQPSPASGSGYVPGSVSAAFVTCPNEKVAKEIARWGPGNLPGRAGLGEGCCPGGWSWIAIQVQAGRAH